MGHGFEDRKTYDHVQPGELQTRFMKAVWENESAQTQHENFPLLLTPLYQQWEVRSHHSPGVGKRIEEEIKKKQSQIL